MREIAVAMPFTPSPEEKPQLQSYRVPPVDYFEPFRFMFKGHGDEVFVGILTPATNLRAPGIGTKFDTDRDKVVICASQTTGKINFQVCSESTDESFIFIEMLGEDEDITFHGGGIQKRLPLAKREAINRVVRGAG